MPFKSKAQQRWMFANEPEMASRWSEHTDDIENLPEKVDELFVYSLSVMAENRLLEGEEDDLEDDDLEDDDEDEEEDLDLGGDYEVGQITTTPTPEIEDDENLKYTRVRNRRKGTGKRRVGITADSDLPLSYKTANKDAATIDRDLFNTDYMENPPSLFGDETYEDIGLRPDMDVFAPMIDKLRAKGYTSGKIADAINSHLKLKLHGAATERGSGQDPERVVPGKGEGEELSYNVGGKRNKPGRPSLKDFKCPNCGGEIEKNADSLVCQNQECKWTKTRALTPTQVMMYLKKKGEITRGEASRQQDLGASIPHNHDDVWEQKDDCPACKFATSFDSESHEEDLEPIRDMLRKLAKDKNGFTTAEAAQALMGSDHMSVNVVTPVYEEPCPTCGSRNRIRQPDDPRNPGSRREWGLYCGNSLCYGFEVDETGKPVYEPGTKQRIPAVKDRFGRPKRQDFPDDDVYKKVKTKTMSQVRVPDRFGNVDRWIEYILRNSPEFVPEVGYADKYFGKGYARKHAGGQGSKDIHWTLGDKRDIKENRVMRNDCPSCEEGHYERCRDEDCPCCHGNYKPSLKEMFDAPPGSTPVQNWNELGTIGNKMKQTADNMDADAKKTPQGDVMLFPKDKNQLPQLADFQQGAFIPMDDETFKDRTTSTEMTGMQSQGTMTTSMHEVFSKRGK